MNQPETNQSRAFTIGEWQVHPNRNCLYRDGNTVSVENKSMDVLVALASRAGDVLSNDDLIDAVWGGRPMGENPVYKCIANLRSALGDDSKAPQYIETIPRKGYRLVAKVSPLEGDAGEQQPAGSTNRRNLLFAATLAVVAVIAFLLVRPDVDEAIIDAGPATDNSIAVLPFENLSGDPDNDYFCNGVADELLNQLAKMPGLRVVARSSSFSLGNQVDNLPDFARRLGVRYLLSGSIQQSDEAIRIRARLLNADGSLVWSNSYDRRPADIIALQDDIASAVATGLALDVGESFVKDPGGPKNFDAYASYLHGSELQRRRSPGWGPAAIAAFQDAIRRDPDFAAAYAGLAMTSMLTHRESAEVYRDAERLIATALKLNPNQAEAHAAAGLLAMHKGSTADYRDAERSLRLAFRLNPSFIEAQIWLSTTLTVLGKREDALRVLEGALAIDPLNPILNMNLGRRYQADGRLDAAREQMVSSLPYPDTPAYVLTWISDIETSAGKLDAALGWVKQGVRDGKFANEQNAWYTGPIATYYAQLGMFEQAERWMAANRQPESSHWRLSFVYALAFAKQDADQLGNAIAEYEASLAGEESLTLMSRSLIGRHAVWNGDYERAIRYLAPIYAEGWTLHNAPGGSTGLFTTLQFYALALQRNGQQEKAAALLHNGLQKQMQYREGRTKILAEILAQEAITYSLLGDQEIALQRFEQAVDAGWRLYYSMLADPRWDGLRESEKFQSLLAQVKRDVDLQRERVLAEERLEPFLPPAT